MQIEINQKLLTDYWLSCVRNLLLIEMFLHRMRELQCYINKVIRKGDAFEHCIVITLCDSQDFHCLLCYFEMQAVIL